MEEWKYIKGYEGLYEINKDGEVYSHLTKRILKHCKSVYPRVTLTKNGKQKSYVVHRLVAINFIPNPYNYEIVNHKDENKSNCRFDNLEWCNALYNHHYKNNVAKRLKVSNYKLQTPVLQLDGDKQLVKEYKNLASTPHYKKGFSKICMEGKFYKGYYWRYKYGFRK